MAVPQFIAPPAFQLYASDFLGSSKVARMSNTEIGVYTLLLCHAWTNNGLPTSIAERARMARTPVGRFEKLWRGVLSECWVERRGRFVNPRQEEIRAKLVAYRKSQAENGAKGGRPRNPKESQLKPNGKPKAKPKETSPISYLQSTDVSKEQKHPVRDFLALYEQLFKELATDAPKIIGRDAKIAKDTIGSYGEERARDLLRAFFASSDPFIQNSGYGLNVFSGQINKLLVGRQVAPQSTARTAGNAAALQAFADRGRTA